MSPEQAHSSGEDIDTRTDVYSLGIILYELLAGAPPLDLRKIAFDEFLRKLREDEPPKPSTKIRTQDPATSTEVARKRQTEPRALAKQMRGDLDSIALKALEKDRSRRYGSPSDFAADIGRYLKNEAVLGGPAFRRVPRPQVRAPLSWGSDHRMRFRLGAHRGGGHQHPAEHAREPGSGRGSGGQRFPAERSAGAGQRSQPVRAERQTRSGPGGANGLRPGSGADRGKVRPATGGGGCHSGHHRADVHGPRAIPRSTDAIGAGAGFAPPGARGRESEDPQDHEPPWAYRRSSGQIRRG